jgi:hypothetical protein
MMGPKATREGAAGEARLGGCVLYGGDRSRARRARVLVGEAAMAEDWLGKWALNLM